MFKRHYEKRSSNILFVIFRLALSLGMFVVLLGGIYAAYKHFSGLDPLKLDPQSVINNLIDPKTSPQLASIFAKLKIDPNILGKSVSLPNSQPTAKPSGNEAIFRFLLMADSHNDNVNLGKALSQAKQQYPDLKFIIGLGDYTEVGTTTELKDAKKVFDSSAIRYFLIPGDHDLWDCRNRSLPPTDCFKQVFGPNYQSFVFDNFQFLLLDNSDNYIGFDDSQLTWMREEFEKVKQDGTKGVFVFLHEPLYHPSSEHIMGWVEKNLKSQSLELIFQLKELGARQIFSGDIHYFSQYLEPKTDLSMVTVGAITSGKNSQAPRFAVVSVFDDGTTDVEDVEIK